MCDGSWAKINGKLIGVGIISFPSGASYQGEWLEHEPHGYGVETSELGAVFEGEFNLGEKHGFGCLTEPDGKKQVGCWSKGKREGWLLSIAAHGAPLTLREHKNDAFVGRQLDGQCEDAKRVQRQAESVLDKARSVVLLCARRSRGKIDRDRFHMLCTECGAMIYVGPNHAEEGRLTRRLSAFMRSPGCRFEDNCSTQQLSRYSDVRGSDAAT